jgi:hypothetical protein
MDATDQAESENPYASPETVETREGYIEVYGRPRQRMPPAVMWVLAYSICAMAGWILIAWNAVGGDLAGHHYVQIGFGIGSFLIAVVGTLARNLLVYRFTRAVITVFGLMLIVSSGGMTWQLNKDRSWTESWMLAYFAITAATLVTVWMLYRKSTKAYFGLQCPECGEFRGVRTNFLQTRVWCRTCRVTW